MLGMIFVKSFGSSDDECLIRLNIPGRIKSLEIMIESNIEGAMIIVVAAGKPPASAIVASQFCQAARGR